RPSIAARSLALTLRACGALVAIIRTVSMTFRRTSPPPCMRSANGGQGSLLLRSRANACGSLTDECRFDVATAFSRRSMASCGGLTTVMRHLSGKVTDVIGGVTCDATICDAMLRAAQDFYV